MVGGGADEEAEEEKEGGSHSFKNCLVWITRWMGWVLICETWLVAEETKFTWKNFQKCKKTL